MELDGGGDGGGSGGGGGGGEGGGGLSMEVEKKNMPEGEPKVKRRMKTPSQLEILEKTYAMETYPSEALRAELSVKLGLTDRQLQMWFCHRRLKDRKPPPEKRQKKSFSPSAAAGPSSGSADEMILDDADVAKESGSGLSLFGNMDLLQQQQRVVHKVGSAVPRISSELPSMRRFYEPPLAISEQRAIAFVEAQLGEPLREDGPILGMEFDPLPPGAFGAPIGQQKPSGQTYDVKLYESPESKQIKAEKMRLKEEMRREKEAAKLKAANDRAAARRIAKESTEMIEDERLELMELAALSRGLSSILALDAETLQNLDMFKDKLPEFPPKSANLKRPFRLQPWTDSEENVGCLLMGNDGENVVSNLRSGVAAENAVAIMQERGLSNPRRSRHRLTPGTVKFAAFHVLSLEGSKGLSILDVADKIQASIPSEALESVWSEEYRRSWGMKLHMASTAEELLQNLTLLETSIKKDFLSANYETTCEILSSRKIVADSLSGPEEVSVLPWIPQTTSAVALQLMELDSSIYYTVHEKESCQKDNQAGYFAKGPLRCYSLERAINNVSQAGYLRQDNWVDLVSGRTNLRRGRGRPRGPSRTRGGKSLRKAINSQDEMRRGSTGKYKFEEFPGWKGRPRGRGGRKKGRRSIRRKQKPNKGLGKSVEKSGMKKSNFGDTPGPQLEEWNLEETPMEVPGGENVSSSGRSEFEDDNSQASADEYDDVSVDDISGVRNGKSRYFTAVDDYKLCGKDGHDDGDDVDENDEYEGDDGDNEQRDFYVDGYFNSDFHEEGNQPTGVEHVRDVLDRGSASSSSSDYSY
ncbi:Homeobox-DDT domain protein RLT2 [Sesamum angolense]|uniref:Homeobox-DDT domain protein RLT2 n=1 Tax=Sesamum angolense TaxID=2727404 RepID=A0AAE1W407_9LAMI|nr:Homeobox-DDT domain protein RLT2 [Sesamum angolense]